MSILRGYITHSKRKGENENYWVLIKYKNRVEFESQFD
jgi:hypothetical protein